VLPPSRRRIWLEPQCPGASDQEWASREGREGHHQLQRALPPPDSDLVEQVLKDPTVTHEAHEREIERGLLIHLRDLLLELGRGFTFVGSQVPLEVG
jgi:predicted nuclease of restriction endonuclease-like (RecB) superfamily